MHARALDGATNPRERKPGGDLERGDIDVLEFGRQGDQELVVLATFRGELLGGYLQPTCFLGHLGCDGNQLEVELDADARRSSQMLRIAAEPVTEVQHRPGTVGREPSARGNPRDRRCEGAPGRGLRLAWRSQASTAARDPPSPPVTQMPSPARAPALPIGRSELPITVTVTTHLSPAERSPPITGRADGLPGIRHTEHQLDDITLSGRAGHHHGRQQSDRLGPRRREVR